MMYFKRFDTVEMDTAELKRLIEQSRGTVHERETVRPKGFFVPSEEAGSK